MYECTRCRTRHERKREAHDCEEKDICTLADLLHEKLCTETHGPEGTCHYFSRAMSYINRLTKFNEKWLLRAMALEARTAPFDINAAQLAKELLPLLFTDVTPFEVKEYEDSSVTAKCNLCANALGFIPLITRADNPKHAQELEAARKGAQEWWEEHKAEAHRELLEDPWKHRDE
jgi:uncharacterized protein YcaQ